MRGTAKYLTFLPFLLGTILLIISCSKQETPTAPQNHLPKIESLTANPNTVLINTETTLTCIASDEDGDNITVTWSSKRGSFPNGVVGMSVKWIAPSIAGKDTISVLLNDGKQTSQAKLEIVVGSISASPTLLSPNNSASEIDLSPNLIWSAVSNAVSYTLQVSTNNSFSSYVFNQSGLTNTSKQISELNSNTIYFWRVRSSNNYGVSGWSVSWTFITTTPTFNQCPGISKVVYAGKIYNAVLIGTQCWLKENLDVGTMIQDSNNQTNNGSIEKHCYNNDANNCTTYGGLYQWAEAVQYMNGATNYSSPNLAFGSNVHGICPSGWHIPTSAEFEILRNAAVVNGNNKALKAIGQGTGSGAGTNTSGFSALLAGDNSIGGGGFYGLGSSTSFWSSTEGGGNVASDMRLHHYDTNIYVINLNKYISVSVRCLKD